MSKGKKGTYTVGAFKGVSDAVTLTSGLNRMLLELLERGENPVEVFTLIITESGKIGIHSKAEITPEFFASIIDIMEDSLRQLNQKDLWETSEPS